MGQPGLNISKLAYSTNTLAILIQCLVTLKGNKKYSKKKYFSLQEWTQGSDGVSKGGDRYRGQEIPDQLTCYKPLVSSQIIE